MDVASGAAVSVMDEWLRQDRERNQPLLAGDAQQGTQSGRACGKASCASGGVLLALSVAATVAAAYCLVESIRLTTRIQGLLVVECNATSAGVVSSGRQCSGSHWQRSLDAYLPLPRWARAAPQECHAPQWQVLAGTVADVVGHTMHSAVATGEYVPDLKRAEAALGSRQLGHLLPCQYDQGEPSVAYWSVDLMERAADGGMALSGAFALLGLVVGLMAALALRVGLQSLREQTPNRGRWQINAPAGRGDDLLPPPVAPGAAAQPQQPYPQPEPQPEPELQADLAVSVEAGSAAVSADDS